MMANRLRIWRDLIGNFSLWMILLMLMLSVLPGGKIVIFTGLLDYFKTDAEITAAIGHEVGHVVGSHFAENMSMFRRVQPSSWQQSMEMEADYIGLLVTASAGYDPRVAPQLYVKLEERDTSLADATYLPTIRSHPHGKERADILSQPEVMDEALAIYWDKLKDKDNDKESVKLQRARERAQERFKERDSEDLG